MLRFGNIIFIEIFRIINIFLSKSGATIDIAEQYKASDIQQQRPFGHLIYTPYNRIEHSTRIRLIRDGQREGLLRIKFVIY